MVGPGMLILRRPAPALHDLIHCLWASDAYAARESRERVLPSGAVRIVIHIEERPLQLYEEERSLEPSRFLGGVLAGARTTPLVIGTIGLGATLGVDFQPGGIRHFLGCAADAVAEQIVPLDAIWGRSASLLREQLLATPGASKRLELLERFLRQRVRGGLQRPATLREALIAFEQSELKSVADVNRRTGLSPRRLSALFREEIGLGPKTFWRLRRFNAAVRSLEQRELRGAALAAECGYFDQSHFIREFRAFAGSSLREYLVHRVAGSDHVRILGKNIQS